MIEVPYFVPGMSKEALQVTYGNVWEVFKDGYGMCRPKEDVHFNYDEYFLTCDTYYYQVDGSGRYHVMSTCGLVVNGLISITKEEFDRYFTIEERS